MLSFCLSLVMRISENNKATCFSYNKKQVAIVWNKWLKLLLQCIWTSTLATSQEIVRLIAEAVRMGMQPVW